MASLSISPAERASIEAFRRDVVEKSMTGIVLVRFTAEWCGPCKTLAPIIDRAIAAAGDPRLSQVVVDIDQNRLLAEQFRIQSVPTVYAFVRGQPVDGFAGARSEKDVIAFIQKLLSTLPPTDAQADLEAMVAAASEALAAGDAELAAEAFGALVQELPDRADIVAGYARALLALGHVDAARSTLATLPTDSKDAAVNQARAALALAETAVPDSETATLQAAVAADPANHQARLDLATALMAKGQNDAAADHLLASIAADRGWNEGAARAKLLQLFEAVGMGDPWTVATRRKLSAILFA
ncbi:tetratricopeptide repeat protein [Sandaracinobacteroides saxicola]|uniref:Tetratricopeptide repeat protein n=1 Tax=Sandaracinobacteroides saxicola TaxID=2759707 RepID=A0A7G5IK83_9SPHN|nr:tetratricopeptide repeat protein [Sandaracinobacteroides saxicola]QMW23775.1 tetratricopeptide repeat protein [Sandaracinobacteroides saxicola]